MSVFTDYSGSTGSIGRTKLWNPTKTLEIINMDPGYQRITCVGYAPSQGRRCRNPIRGDNQAFITRVLDEISYLNPSSPTVISRLRELSGPALCVRYHQNQAQEILMQWKRKIQQLEPEVEEWRHESTHRIGKKPEENVETLQGKIREISEILASLQQQVDDQRRRGQALGRQTEYHLGGEESLNGWREERASRMARERCQEEELEREKLEREEFEREYLEKKRLKKERLEKERLEKERLEKERLEKERLEKERIEKERVEKQRLEAERREKERQEVARKEREEAERRERAAQNERIRTRAQKLRAEREREKREKEQKEQEEWDQSWTRYQEQWVKFRSSTSSSRQGNIQDHIPWPVKSGLYSEVTKPKVKEFFQRAVPKDVNMAKLSRKECQKWHPDSLQRFLQDAPPNEAVKMMLKFICQEVTGMLNDSAGRSSDFVG